VNVVPGVRQPAERPVPHGSDPPCGRARRLPDGLLAALIAVALFALYAGSSPRGLALEDDGLFVMASYANGIAHPPGYPLFTLLGHVASRLPIGEVAWRVHLVSALFGALACAVLFAVLRRLALPRLPAAAATLAFGTSAVFWSQAIIAEVYTLNALFSLLLWWLVLTQLPVRVAGPVTGSSAPSPTVALAGGLLYGLGLSNHWPLLVLFSAGLALLAWPLWRGLWRRLPWVLGGLAIGLLPYLWLYLRSQADPLISYSGPLDGWSDLWAVISRDAYRGLDNVPTAGWSERLSYAGFVATEAGRQFTLPGTLLAALGAVVMQRRHGWRMTLAVVAGMVATSLLLVALLNREFDALNRLVFRVYPIPAYALLAVWLGFGLDAVLRAFDRHNPTATATTVNIVLALAVATLPLVAHAPLNLRHDYRWAELYGETLLGMFDEGATVLVENDVEVGSLGYLHYVVGQRPDLRLVHPRGRVFKPPPALPRHLDDEAQQRWFDEIRAGGRAVYHLGNDPALVALGRDYGLFSRVEPVTGFEVGDDPDSGKLLDAFERLLAEPPSSDPWTRTAQAHVAGRAVAYLWSVRGREGFPPERLERLMGLALGYLEAKTVLVSRLLNADPGLTSYRRRVSDLLQRAEEQIDEASVVESTSSFYLVRGYFAELRGAQEAARDDYLRAVEIMPRVSNPAFSRLLDVYMTTEDFDGLVALGERFPWLGVRVGSPKSGG